MTEMTDQDKPDWILALNRLLIGIVASVVIAGVGLFAAHHAGWIDPSAHTTPEPVNSGQSGAETQTARALEPDTKPLEALPAWVEALLQREATEMATDLEVGIGARVLVEFGGADVHTYSLARGAPVREVRVQVRVTLTAKWNYMPAESVRSGIGRRAEELALRVDRDYGIEVRSADGALISASLLGSLTLGKDPVVGTTATAELRVPADAEVGVLYLGTPVQRVTWHFRDGQWSAVGRR